MKITIEIDNKGDLKKLNALFKAFKINTVKVVSANDTDMLIKRGDKKIDPKSLFGIWANKPRSLENIRRDAWHRNHVIE